MRGASFELHSHTNMSDGELTPIQLLEKAADYDIDTLAITDHDTVAAYTPETLKRAEELGIRLIPGIEISTQDENAYRFHILGIGIDIANEGLQKAIENMRSSRLDYTRDSSEALIRLGFMVDVGKLKNTVNVITKAHIADLVLANPANQPLLLEYFDGQLPRRGAFIEKMMIGDGPAATARKGYLKPEEATVLIKQAGGISVIAHPVASLFEGMPEDYLYDSIERIPVDGFEAFYIYYARSMQDRRIDMIDTFTNLAQQHDKLITAGSDYHGPGDMQSGFVDLGFQNQAKIPSRSILERVLNSL